MPKYGKRIFVAGQFLFNEFITSNFQINSKSKDEKMNIIPTWIKNNAEWWAAGAIDDESFIQGIQFLVKDSSNLTRTNYQFLHFMAKVYDVPADVLIDIGYISKYSKK